MSVRTPHATAHWTVRRKLALQLALAPVILLAVEGLFRVGLAVRGEAYDSGRARAELTRTVDRMVKPLVAWNTGTSVREVDDSNRRVASPYYGWDYVNHFRELVKTARYFETDLGVETYDIAIVGGSVAAGFAQAAKERLFERLSADPRLADRPLRILKIARGGYKQPQQVNMVAYLLLMGWAPDAVVNIDGFNEVAIGNQNAQQGAHPLYPSVSHWGHMVTNGRSGDDSREAALRLLRVQADIEAFADLGRAMCWSAILGRAAQRRMSELGELYQDANKDYVRSVQEHGARLALFGPSFDPALDEVAQVIARGWAEGSRSLQAICTAEGIDYVHVLQPTLHDEGAKSPTATEIRVGGMGRACVCDEFRRRGYGNRYRYEADRKHDCGKGWRRGDRYGFVSKLKRAPGNARD
jgi:hypothetical protein